MSWLQLAVDCVELVASRCDKDAQKSFRTRARQIPADIYYVGAAYAFAVLAARSSEGLIFAPGPLGERIERICGGDAGREERYALYGTCLLEALKRLGIAGGNLGGVLKELEARGGVVEAQLGEFASWLKKLAEAKFEA